MKRLAYLLSLAFPDAKPEQILPALTLLVMNLQLAYVITRYFAAAALKHLSHRPVNVPQKPALSC